MSAPSMDQRGPADDQGEAVGPAAGGQKEGENRHRITNRYLRKQDGQPGK